MREPRREEASPDAHQHRIPLSNSLGAMLVWATEDGLVHVLDLERYQRYFTCDEPGHSLLDVSPDGARLVSVSQNYLRVFRLPNKPVPTKGSQSGIAVVQAMDGGEAGCGGGASDEQNPNEGV